MSTRKCCISGCTSQEGQEKDLSVTFHRFPNNSQQQSAWIKACHCEANFRPSKSSYVCSRHFKRENFTTQSNGKIILKSNSTPSIFPWNKDEVLAAKKAASADKTTTDTKTTTQQSKESEAKEKPTTSFIEPTETKKKADTRKSLATIPVTPKADEQVKKSKRLSEKLSASKKVTSPVKTPKADEKKKSQAVATPSNVASTSTSTATTANVEIVAKEIKKETTETPTINFIPGTSIEALNFDGKWISVKVVEVDMEEREVLVRFLDKSNKSKSGVNDEWISMASSRLRPAQPQQTFEVGEKVLARWNDCRKFPATINRVLENDFYDVLFDDGYPKIVRGVHINKFNLKNAPKTPTVPAVAQVINPLLLNPPALIPDYIKAMKDLPEAPKEGAWCCVWVDDIPIGEESFFDGPHGKLPSIVVPDWRVKEGWQKHIYLRQNGKWDILFISPENRKLRFKNEMKTYLMNIGETYDPEAWDFSLHKKRSKLENLCITTDKFKTQSMVNEGSQPNANPFASLGALPYIQQNLVLPIPTTSEVRVGSLKVKVVDNIYQCPQESCDKTFRKENHLQLHIKHYHVELAKLMGDCPNMEDLAYLRTTTDEPEVTPSKQPRKSHGPKIKREDSHIKTELYSPDSKLHSQRSPILEEALKSPIIASLLRTSPIKSEHRDYPSNKMKSESSHHIPMFDPEAMIPPHAVSRTIHKLGKRKAKFGKRIGAHKKRRIESRPKERPYSSIPGVIPYNEGPYMKSHPNQLVDENGDVIKIVRMKKEEIINCGCGFGEEDGLMIQCELCLCWQHGLCNLIERPDQVPENYVCYICKNPYRMRMSQRYLNYQEWLTDGKLPIGNYHMPNSKQTARFDSFKQCHKLIGNLLEMKRFMHSLDVKINIAEKQGHPKLYLWAKKWETAPKNESKEDIEKIKLENVNADDVHMMPLPIIPEPDMAIEPAKCQQNILEHIQNQQTAVNARLETIDAEISALEDTFSENSKVDDVTLKNTLYMLIGDLAKMNKIAQIHKTEVE